MDRRAELVAAEDRLWLSVMEIVEGMSSEDLLRVGVTPEWSVKDLMAHLGCWMAECAHVLERMRMATYERERMDVDARNKWFYEMCRDLDLVAVKVLLQSARVRMLQEWYALTEVTQLADRWFDECGPSHLDEHLDGLWSFVGESGGLPQETGGRPQSGP